MILIISGLPGAGKTTVSRLVAEGFARSARIDGDDAANMIVNGRVSVAELPDPEAQRQLLLRARNICALAGNFADADFTPVIDHVVPDRQVLDLMLDILAPRPVLFVVLAPPPEVSRQRNLARAPEQRVDLDVTPLTRTMRDELGDVGWWLDTAGQTPGETAAEIATHAAHRARVG